MGKITNLHKKCYKCGKFFPAKPLELKFFCDKQECKESNWYHFHFIKQNRHIPADHFDIYDLDRPIIRENNIVGYERVCRECGNPLLNKKGKYSYQKRYCNEHRGNGLWARYNWGVVSKNYAYEIQENNKKHISKMLEFHEKREELLDRITVCEECSKLCLISDSYWYRYKSKEFSVINIHHKIPVHKLDKDNFYLIWDKSNLIALCEECHNQQDHQLKVKADPYIHFRKITEFLNSM